MYIVIQYEYLYPEFQTPYVGILYEPTRNYAKWNWLP